MTRTPNADVRRPWQCSSQRGASHPKAAGDGASDKLDHYLPETCELYDHIHSPVGVAISQPKSRKKELLFFRPTRDHQ
eukprot:103948-Pleurochrysis_carterae.AAC.2